MSNLENLRLLKIPSGLTGKGVKVAVLDDHPDGFHSMAVQFIIRSIAPDVQIQAFNVLTSEGYVTWEQAFAWCLENDCKLANMSLQTMRDESRAELLARMAHEHGINAIAAAGNHGDTGSDTLTFPGSHPDAITVVGYNVWERRITGTASAGAEVVIAAPGRWYVPRPEAAGGGWWWQEATSFAAPVITGVLALYSEYLGRHPTPAEARKFVTSNAVDIEAEGPDRRSGAGLFVWPDKMPAKEEIILFNPDYTTAVWKGSPNYTNGRIEKPSIIVCHIMAGTLVGTDSWFASKAAQVSAHYGVGKDGQVHQYVLEADTAWHVAGHNNCSIGIEFEGQSGDVMPEAQYQAGLALIRDVCRRQGIRPGRETILGHYQLDPVDRPNCPGPRFPWERLYADLSPMPVTDYAGHWAEGSIEKVKALGLMLGDPGGKFRPNDPVTRAELATVLARLNK